MIKLKTIVALSFLLMSANYVITPTPVEAHCQIPCGIYDDHDRIEAMLEDVATIKKSIKSMNELAGKTDVQSQNQMVRWVMNKEKHAQKIIETISDYFLTQRVKDSQDDYSKRLVDHHQVIVAAMKAKQNSDLKFAELLEEKVKVLEAYYPEHKH